MKNSLDIHQALKVFHKILQYGFKQGSEYRLNGIVASSDFDGYSVYLNDDKVSLSIFFHNKYDLQYSNQFEQEAFFDKLSLIEKTQYAE